MFSAVTRNPRRDNFPSFRNKRFKTFNIMKIEANYFIRTKSANFLSEHFFSSAFRYFISTTIFPFSIFNFFASSKSDIAFNTKIDSDSVSFIFVNSSICNVVEVFTKKRS